MPRPRRARSKAGFTSKHVLLRLPDEVWAQLEADAEDRQTYVAPLLSIFLRSSYPSSGVALVDRGTLQRAKAGNTTVPAPKTAAGKAPIATVASTPYPNSGDGYARKLYDRMYDLIPGLQAGDRAALLEQYKAGELLPPEEEAIEARIRAGELVLAQAAQAVPVAPVAPVPGQAAPSIDRMRAEQYYREKLAAQRRESGE